MNKMIEAMTAICHPVAIYLDLEMTCWNTTPPIGMKPEIIEIGLVAMDLSKLEILDEASYFVRPKRWEVSATCTKLTGITDQDIRSAKPLAEVLASLVKRFDPQGKPCCTWGEDVPILAQKCREIGLPSPFRFAIDLSRVFQGAFATKEQIGLKAATEILSMKFDGIPHGALPDARNTAFVHASLLRRMHREPDPIRQSSAADHVATSLSPFAQKLKDSINKEDF